MASITSSVEKQERSSWLPPPRPTIKTSTFSKLLASLILLAMVSSAPFPWTEQGKSTIFNEGARRLVTSSIS